MADKRLIDANAIPWEECFIPVESQLGWKFKRDESVHKSTIDQMPTEDAVPVVHGRWEKVGKHDWRCSVCKIGVPYSYTGFNHCPDCGAKMDGGEQDGTD